MQSNPKLYLWIHHKIAKTIVIYSENATNKFGAKFVKKLGAKLGASVKKFGAKFGAEFGAILGKIGCKFRENWVQI